MNDKGFGLFFAGTGCLVLVLNLLWIALIVAVIAGVLKLFGAF